MDPATAESEIPQVRSRADRAEQRLLGALESISDGFALFDAEDRLLYVNDNYLSIHRGRREDYPAGMSFEAATRRAAHSGQITEAVGREDAWIAERMASHRSTNVFFLRQLSDGRWIQGTETRTGDGSLVVTLADITQAKENEKALRKNEQRFRDFTDAASDWFWEMDEALRFIYFSDAFWKIDPKVPEQLIGKTRRELIERGDPVIDDTASRADWLGHIADLEAHRPFRNMVHARRHGDGALRYYTVSGTPHFDAEGKFKGYRGVAENVTARRRAEQELLRREEQLSAAQRIGHMGHWRFALDLTKLEWSDELWNLYGVDRFTFQPDFDNVTAMIHDDDQARFQALRRQAVETAQPYGCEVRIVRPDGEIRHVRIEGRPELDSRGKTASMFGITQDISEQKRAEDELKRRERALSEAQRIGRIGHWRWDKASDIVERSDEMCRLMGLEPSAENPLARDGDAMLHPDDLQHYLAQFYRSINAGEVYETEYRFITGNGETRFFKEIGQPLQDSGGRVTGAFGIIQDITEQKRAEAALRQRERELSEAQRIGQIGHWRSFPEDDRITLSMEMYRIYGVDPATFDLTLESVNHLVHEDDLQQVRRQRARSLKAGKPYTNECRIVRPNGEIRHLWSEGHPECDDSGKVVSVFGVSRDITEARQAEAALRESEQRNRAIVEALDQADVGVCIQRFGQKVNFANSALTHIAGYDAPEELVDRTWVELQGEGGTDLLKIQGDILESLKQTGHWSGELDWMRPDGTRITVDARSASFPGGKAIHILTDITARKERERQQAELTEQLRQAQKMEALGQLAGGTAHEINNLLHPIITFAKLTHDRVEDEKLRHYLERIMECGRKAKEVVGDVLIFARKAPGKREEVDLNGLLARGLRFARDLVPREVELDAAFPERAGRALVNETEFIQVVLNLVKNAADALEGAGTIQLTARIARFDEKPALQMALAPGAYLEISVKDRGCGMTKAIKQRIFEPFFTTKPVGTGTGLGLAVAYGIVQDWGGSITVDTKFGEGSTFTVYLKTLEITDDSRGALSA